MLQQEYRTNDAIERTVAPDLGIAARLLRDQGISTIPIKADGSKAPCITWKATCPSGHTCRCKCDMVRRPVAYLREKAIRNTYQQTTI